MKSHKSQIWMQKASETVETALQWDRVPVTVFHLWGNKYSLLNTYAIAKFPPDLPSNMKIKWMMVSKLLIRACLPIQRFCFVSIVSTKNYLKRKSERFSEIAQIANLNAKGIRNDRNCDSVRSRTCHRISSLKEQVFPFRHSWNCQVSSRLAQ